MIQSAPSSGNELVPCSPDTHHPSGALDFITLEITRRCNLECSHCYAESGPQGNHGSMTFSDWSRLLDQAAALGCRTVQLIGGEPTIHPCFEQLVQKADSLGLRVEVYSNLFRVPEHFWRIFQECNVTLATSFYSDNPLVHDLVTGHSGSQSKTLKNIVLAVEHGTPIRVGLTSVRDDQDLKTTESMLRSRGVTDISIDRARPVGRAKISEECSTDALCGSCTGPVLAVDPDGNAFPCVFSRWLPVGNVLKSTLSEILTSHQRLTTIRQLDQAFASRESASQPKYRESEDRPTSILSSGLPSRCNPQHFPPPTQPPQPPGPCGPCNPQHFPQSSPSPQAAAAWASAALAGSSSMLR